MRNLKFCANLNFMFQEKTNLLQRYDAAKLAGFKGVEVGFPYDFSSEELANKKKETGLEQILLNTYPGDEKAGDKGLAGLPGREKDFEKALEISLKYADSLECKRLHFMCGKVSPGHENSKAVLSTLERNLRFALPELEKRGIVGLIEPINNFTIPGYALSDFDAALTLIKSINSSHIRLQLDVFHLQHIHGNLTHRIENAFPYLGHIQIAQVPFRNEPHLPGEIDYGYLFNLLENLGYDGWIGLEYKPANQTEEGLKLWMDKLKCIL